MQASQLTQPFGAGRHLYRMFVLWRLFAGLGLIALGAVLLGSVLVVFHTVALPTMVVGPVVAAVGLLFVVNARAQACVACATPLEDASTVFPLELMPDVEDAVARAARGDVETLLRLERAPHASMERMAAVVVDYCPKCRGVAEVSTATSLCLRIGASVQEGATHRVELVGPAVDRVLEMVDQRNTAITREMYFGPRRP